MMSIMRTTLDLDDTVLAAARSLARAHGISLGRAVSQLAMEGLRPDGGSRGAVPVDMSYSPFPVIVGDVLATDELVAKHRDD